ncbi:hypothetical protein [Amycolatopsis pithecellobii]|uniref:Uncharacterized protein n=1 Tax=Amycolatopsis pithecellobii TaxID=664692 RepID=A0A6N7YRT0_9PSEU|nr:hypothetical protein [Amycolatopsis pithecellobii]MTD55737.1 hypothetical protein [Amycolatopsis pithecellobii]
MPTLYHRRAGRDLAEFDALFAAAGWRRVAGQDAQPIVGQDGPAGGPGRRDPEPR